MPRGTERDGRSGEVFFEFTQLGNQMRVAAIDVATSTEVVVIAPLVSSRVQMQNVALAKLRRRLASPGTAPATAPDPEPGPGSRVHKTV